MADVALDNCTREEARGKVVRLVRKRDFHVETLKDGRKVTIRTDGERSEHDFIVHVDGEKRELNHIDDFFVDLIKKQAINQEEVLKILVGMKQVAELMPYSEVETLFPELGRGLPGESVEFLAKVMRWLALREEVVEWDKSKGAVREGRDKPLNALNDYFRKGAALKSVIQRYGLHY